MKDRTTTAAVVLAAGDGRRFGRAKQFETIGGQTLIGRVVNTASSVCDLVVVVVPATHRPGAGEMETCWEGTPVHAVVGGGCSHGESARIGLNLVPDDVAVVVIAAASHPLASSKLYQRTVEAVAAGATAAAPAGLIADAVKQHHDGAVVASVDKSRLVIAQAPYAIDRAALVEAYQTFGGNDQPPFPPEVLEMIESCGGSVALVEGEPTNIHITTPLELDMARRLADLVPGPI